jgi:hypothetical protein
VFQRPAARDNAGNNVDIILNVHDVFQGSAARDNAGNNVDIILNVHDVSFNEISTLFPALPLAAGP